MKRGKKIGLWILGLLLIILLFMAWYKQTYSMEEVEQFEVNDPTFEHRVLIATQGSAFKDSVVHEVIRELKSKAVYIKVIDVTQLSGIKEDDWAAIVILHTWENWKPQEDAKLFIESAKNKQKLIVLSTSGQGDYKIEGIDGITSASKLSDATTKAKEITMRVIKLLNVP